MIFLDANVFVRSLVLPSTPFDVTMAAQAAELFRRAERDEIAMTTSEAIVAEVVFILSARNHYNIARSDVGSRIRPLLQIRACRIATKAVCLRALAIWELHPKLSFPDALSAAHSEFLDYELATFDRDLAGLPSIKPFQW